MQTEFTLTEDQDKALNAFFDFLASPTEKVFVLSGYSGCGKSTLVRIMLERIPAFEQALRLINPEYQTKKILLTATTNKAAENLARISNMYCCTIHSALQLRVSTNYKTGESTIVPTGTFALTDSYVFIDEASFIDKQLLDLIFLRTIDCKIIFIGDPAQLAPVKSTGTPAFSAGFKEARLTEVVRQIPHNPIVDLSTALRNTVNSGKWFQFQPDGFHVQHLSRDDFDKEIVKEFQRNDWKYHDSKILAWTNKTVIEYNRAVNQLVKGRPHFEVGDYAVCNSYIQYDRANIKTDQLVEITDLSTPYTNFHTTGVNVELDGRFSLFMPDSWSDVKAALAEAKRTENYYQVKKIEETWVDLRAAYAQTVNKSQGSTYEKVFIDLDDLSRCTNGNMLARMLYVAVSRARNQVFLTGDLA